MTDPKLERAIELYKGLRKDIAVALDDAREAGAIREARNCASKCRSEREARLFALYRDRLSDYYSSCDEYRETCLTEAREDLTYFEENVKEPAR